MKEMWADAVRAHGRWLPAATMLFAFLMSLWQQVLPISLALFIIAWWISGPVAFSWRWETALPWTALLYLLHIAGMAWSTNMEYGAFDLEIKTSLLLLPLLGMLKPLSTRVLLAPAMLAFCAGNALAVLLGIANIIMISTSPGAPPIQQVISGPSFAPLLHPSYFALHLNLAVAGILLIPVHRSIPRWVLIVLLILLLKGIILCGSKTGWLALPLVLAWVLVVKWREPFVRSVVGGLALAGIMGIGLLVAFSPFVRERVVEMYSAAFTPGVRSEAGTSTEIRKMAWSAAWEVGVENLPLGTGTGDVKDELIRTYVDRGYERLVELRINAHSQFLQMLAALGIPGLLLTIAMLLVPLLQWKRSGHLLQLFLLLCLFNWAVESMLEVQAGVLFSAFFALLLSPIPERSSHRDPIQPPAHR